jgi:hypothetical protein
MDTMTYTAVAAFRGNAVERNNELPVYYPEKKQMKVQHFLQASSLVISKHRCRSCGWCSR